MKKTLFLSMVAFFALSIAGITTANAQDVKKTTKAEVSAKSEVKKEVVVEKKAVSVDEKKTVSVDEKKAVAKGEKKVVTTGEKKAVECNKEQQAKCKATCCDKAEKVTEKQKLDKQEGKEAVKPVEKNKTVVKENKEKE